MISSPLGPGSPSRNQPLGELQPILDYASSTFYGHLVYVSFSVSHRARLDSWSLVHLPLVEDRAGELEEVRLEAFAGALQNFQNDCLRKKSEKRKVISLFLIF